MKIAAVLQIIEDQLIINKMILKQKLFIFILICFFTKNYSQSKNDSLYFYNNSVNLEDDKVTKDDFVKNNLTNYQYYFFGETHYREENIKLFRKNITWLNSFNNCNSVVLEYSYSDEESFNNYVVTGDTSILKIYLDSWSKVESTKLIEILKILRSFYLIQNKAIKIYCIDVEKDFKFSFWYLYKIIDKYRKINKLCPDNVKNGIDYTRSLYFQRKQREKQVKSFVVKMNTDLNLYENEYRNYLENDYVRFKEIIRRMEITNRKNLSFIRREDFLYENFKSIIKEKPNEPIYTQLGSFHTLLLTDTVLFKPSNLVQRLCEKDGLQSKICSIYPFYLNSVYGDYFYNDERKKIINLANNKMILLRLDGKDSKYINFYKHFQYLLIL